MLQFVIQPAVPRPPRRPGRARRASVGGRAGGNSWRPRGRPQAEERAVGTKAINTIQVDLWLQVSYNLCATVPRHHHHRHSHLCSAPVAALSRRHRRLLNADGELLMLCHPKKAAWYTQHGLAEWLPANAPEDQRQPQQPLCAGIPKTRHDAAVTLWCCPKPLRARE